MLTATESNNAGIKGALAQITRRNSFLESEQRLVEKMKPARLMPFNYGHENGRAASIAVIKRIRR